MYGGVNRRKSRGVVAAEMMLRWWWMCQMSNVGGA